MDCVFIRGLTIEACIGVHAWEKERPRPLVLDLELGSDIARAAATDHLADALDYEAVSQRLREEVSANRYELVETLAERCATLLLEEFAVPWVRLSLNKPGAIGEGIDVGVRIERGRRSGWSATLDGEVAARTGARDRDGRYVDAAAQRTEGSGG